MKPAGRLPSWLKRRMPASRAYGHTHHVLSSLGLETICTNANCPNRGHCWDRGTATVLILGNICTRNCGFCSVAHGRPEPPDPTEPKRVSDMARQMKLKYLVLTSVDRDDLPDGGASHFRDVVDRCRVDDPDMKFELLTPDFKGCQDRAIEILAEALPFVFGHNIETVPSLYARARPGSDYTRSLDLLKKAKLAYPDTPVKSSMMLGLGETDEEVVRCLKDLLDIGCDRIALGQYLKPSKGSLDVIEYIEPERFNDWAKRAKQMGFDWVMSSPFTRSSYHAEQSTTD